MSDLAAAPNIQFEYGDLIGCPFRLGARGPDEFDCYGLVMELYRRAGQSVPDYRSPEVLAKVAAIVDEKRELWTPCSPGPGAVMVIRAMGVLSHVAVLLPYDRMIHVWERSHGVCVEPIEPWKRRIVGYYRYDPQ